MKNSYFILTFNSTHSSISSEKLLEEYEIPHKLIPVPQSVSAGCGFCLRLPEESFAAAKSILCDNGIEVSGTYLADKNGLKITYTNLEV